MSEEAIARIPGTTFSLKFGVEGKYYAVFLCRGRAPFKTKQLSILKGATLSELPEEVENGLRFLLDTEEVYLSPVIVNRVVNDLIEQIPKDGQVFVKETTEKEYVTPTTSVSEMISKSEDRAGKKSIIEHKPSEKSKFDATADDIGKRHLKPPKPLPKRDLNVEHTNYKPAISSKDDYLAIDEKVSTLTNDLLTVQGTVEKHKKEITNLKKQITKLKKQTKELIELAKPQTE